MAKRTYPLLGGVDTGQSKAHTVMYKYKSDPVATNSDGTGLIKGLPLVNLGKNEYALFAVEKPRNWKWFKEAATAGNRAAREIEETWRPGPRKKTKAIIVFVDVSDWRRDLGITIQWGGPPKERRAAWKAAAREYCLTRLKYDPGHDPDGDKAEARCILEWLMDQEKAHRRGLPNAIGE